MLLAGEAPVVPKFLIEVVHPGEQGSAEYASLRHDEFVDRQHLFARSDRDEVDLDSATVYLLARDKEGRLLGGVRLGPHPMVVGGPDIGWWTGTRLVVTRGCTVPGVGSALVRAACAHVERLGVLRFEAAVQDRYRELFLRLGWSDGGAAPTLGGREHRHMSWQLDPVQRAVDSTKAMLSTVLRPFAEQSQALGGHGFRGDDGAPVPGTDVIAACDAILPAMVDRDPQWAGWCSVLVNINDLSAMGAQPVGLLDAVAAPTRAHLEKIIRGIADAAQAWGVPVLGGHTQTGVPASLAMTALGRTSRPVPAGGGRAGDALTIVADTSGHWRAGYSERQWDSTSGHTAETLHYSASLVQRLAPAAAKDVSMAGAVGTVGMLAEASGVGAELDVARIPRPAAASMGAWLTCFPGFAMVLADRFDRAPVAVAAPFVSARCGRLVEQRGVRLRWPDGTTTSAVRSGVTGLGAA